MNTQEKILTALVYAAQYLRQCAEKLKHFDSNTEKIEDQLSNIELNTGSMAISLECFSNSRRYNTLEYWSQLQINITRELLPGLITKYDEDVAIKIAMNIAHTLVTQFKADPYFNKKLTSLTPE